MTIKPANKSEGSKERIELEKDRLKRQTDQAVTQVKTSISNTSFSPTTIYLLAYNLISALLWANLLFITISFLLRSHFNPTSTSFWTRILAGSPTIRKLITSIPSPLSSISVYLSGSYGYKNLGWYTKYTQSLAVLEVVHSILGLTKSSVGTAAMQVASRLWTVWAVVEAKSSTHNNPLFTTMLLAWSITEVIRYTYYFFSLLHIKSPILDHLRYNPFVLLYPIGASSEAFLAASTFPPIANHVIQSLFKKFDPVRWTIVNLPPAARKRVVNSPIGKKFLWDWAQRMTGASTAQKQKWEVMDYARVVMFVIWWPSLVVLMGHMFKLRRKVLGKGRTLSQGKKIQ